MGLSSNILWHMTNRKAFFSILKSQELRYSYSLERVMPIPQGVAFPMIGMCDLPFSEIATTKWSYGNYAIGLSREWGLKKGFSPVWYSDYDSRMLRELGKLFEETGASDNGKYFDSSIYLFSNVKFVQAPLKTSKKQFKNYRFYDEREYRLVPYLEETYKLGYQSFLMVKAYELYKEDKGSSLLDYGVDFGFEDVRYLIVKSDSNVREVKALLSKFKNAEHIIVVTKKDVLEDFIGTEHNEEILLSAEQFNYAGTQRHVDRMFDMNREALKERRIIKDDEA